MADKQPDKTEKNAQADLQQVVAPIKDANNVLVTINSDPTVDQLASCIGFTLVLNKLGKHATAVFSGQIPSTLEFLKPEETLEKDTDSLRDFIIALDKSKADKLRYKVEDDVVKIFITPYKTSIDEKDLQFSQGDFNVDVVVALGVDEKKHLDKAILDHGRILHDATVISINTQGNTRLGAINWSSAEASSLCEMIADVVQSLSKDILDTQNATALLTGIVAETERYSNEKATPHTMSIAASLMSAGASTQLVSNELDKALKNQGLPAVSVKEGQDSTGENGGNGELDIEHTDDEENQESEEAVNQEENKEEDSSQGEDKSQDSSGDKDEYLEHLNLSEEPTRSVDQADEVESQQGQEAESGQQGQTSKPTGSRLVKEPPHFSGQLTANTTSEDKQYSGSTDPLTNMPDSTILGQKDSGSLQQKVDQTLKEIEESVSSPHLSEEEQQKQEISPPPPSLDEARKAAEAAAEESSERPQARKDSGSSQLGDDIDHDENNKNDSSPPSTFNSSPPPPTPPPISPLS